MMNVGWSDANGLKSGQSAPRVPLSQPDAAAVQQFDSLMASPQAVALVTDEQLAKLPESELARLRNQWGADEAGLRADARTLLDLREKVVVDAIMKAIKKAGERDRD